MKTEFRNRAFLPVVLPLAILATIAIVVGGFAALLLWNTRWTAIVLAGVVAAGILVTASLSSSQDRLDPMRRSAVGLAVLVPVLLGGLVATGVLGNVADADRNINREPHGPQFLLPAVPEGIPTLGATSINSFCLPQADGSCTDTREWDIPAEEAPEVFQYAFDNLNEGVDHNLVLYSLSDPNATQPEPNLGGDLLTPEVPDPFPGVEERAYEFSWPDGQAPQTFFFQCTVHPSTMYGIAKIVSG
jgi:hypothetical protein